MYVEGEEAAEVEFSNEHLEIRLVIKMDKASGAVATGHILDGTSRLLAAALTTLNVPRVERTLELWHEARAREAREAEDI